MVPLRGFFWLFGSAGRQVGRSIEHVTGCLAAPRLWVYMGVWLQISGNDGVLVEYGEYAGSDGGRYGYFDTDGARFTKLTRSGFDAQFSTRILCRASKNLTFDDLAAKSRGSDTPWRKKDYNVATHNCHSFANFIILETRAQLVRDVDKVFVMAEAPPAIAIRLLNQSGSL
jgi:hypothetical protein